MTQAPETTLKAYCNTLALQRGLDPAGSAGDFEDLLIIEVPLPWKRSLYQEAGALPQEVINLLDLWLQRYKAGQGYRHRLLLVAPDHRYSQRTFRRVMFYTRQPGAFAQFDKIEYLVPETEMGALAWALHESRSDLPTFESYRQPQADHIRDLLVCTHGTIDAACAKFGYPLYNDLRRNHASENLRVWRVSHFGGHVFAPTMLDMPTGHFWAYVEESQAAQIVTRTGDVSALRGHYRGWAGLESGFLQAMERDLWQQHGWAWFDYPKSGETLAQDENGDDPAWVQGRITFTPPDMLTPHSAQARIEIHRHIETISTTGYPDTYPYPQYAVHLHVPAAV